MSIELTRDEKVLLQILRCTGHLPYFDTTGRLTKAGLVGDNGLLTEEGRLAADAILAEDEEI